MWDESDHDTVTYTEQEEAVVPLICVRLLQSV